MDNDDYYRNGLAWRRKYPKLPASTLILVYVTVIVICVTVSYVAYITH